MRAWLCIVLGVGVPAVATANTSVGDNQTVTVDCAKDSHVDVAGNGSKVTVIGDCFVVVVSGHDNTVVIASTKNFGLSSEHNTVTVTVGETAALLGEDNTVTWKPLDTKKPPKVTDHGKRNKVTRAK